MICNVHPVPLKSFDILALYRFVYYYYYYLTVDMMFFILLLVFKFFTGVFI